MGKSKSTSTNEPSAYSKGYITPAADNLQSAYQSVQPQTQAFSQSLFSQLPGLSEKAFGSNPLLEAGQGYATDVLSGKYLNGNPYLQSQIDQTNQSVSGKVNSIFSAAGRTGSNTHAYDLAKGLGEAQNNLRYADYANQMQNMNTALSQIPALQSAQYAGIAPLLATYQAASGVPLSAAQQYAGGIGNLVGNYNTQTTTQQQGLGSILGGLAGAGLAGWASGGFKGVS